MRKRHILTLIFIVSIIHLGCIRQIKMMQRFAHCDFKIVNVDSIYLSNTPINQLSFNLSTLLEILQNPQAPVCFNVYIQAKNKNRKIAAMNQMDWQLFIEDKNIISGKTNNKVVIMPMDSTVFSIKMNLDLIKDLHVKDIKTLLKLYNSLNSENPGVNSTNHMPIKIMVKPSFYMGRKLYTYPNFIPIYKDKI